MQSHFSSNVFTAISRCGILNSLIFMKARSMEAWIPVISSSLYFRKSVFKIPLHMFLRFSFWVYSILKWVAYIKLKVSWRHAFLWCMSQTSRHQDNSRSVQTHKKNSGDTVCEFNSIIQSIFCAQSGGSIRLTIWKWGSGELGYPGNLPPVLENSC